VTDFIPNTATTEAIAEQTGDMLTASHDDDTGKHYVM
jgi:hypothetical protein